MRVSVLGSTGVVGRTTLQVIKRLNWEVAALSAHTNRELLQKQLQEFGGKALPPEEAAQEGDIVVLAIPGMAALKPAIAALKAKKRLAVANKEIFAAAGDLLMQMGGEILPVDGELGALFQCLQGERQEAVSRLILTASGGPFLRRQNLDSIQLAEALQHPHYAIGKKGYVDSSTLMNKGLEMIAAQHLFGVPPEKIEAVIHPEQHVNALVEFVDGSVMAQMSERDLSLAVQWALTWPKREAVTAARYDFTKTLHFEVPDKRFLCLELAVQAMREGKSYPCFLAAANERLVERFLQKEIGWQEIGRKLAKLISSHLPEDLLTLESILELDGQARRKASEI